MVNNLFFGQIVSLRILIDFYETISHLKGFSLWITIVYLHFTINNLMMSEVIIYDILRGKNGSNK